MRDVASSFGTAIVIVNSRAGAGRRGFDIEALMNGTGIAYEIRRTEHSGHAVELAKQAVTQGHSFMVAVGGDGTIHEVVNGMLAVERDGSAPELVLGIIPSGSGSDFIRTFGLPPDAADAVEHLKGENLFKVDVGRVGYTDRQGQTQFRFFPNIAEAGLGGEVVRRAEALPRRVGKLRYLLSFWMTLGLFKPTEGTVVLDERTYEGRVTNLVVANAQFFGGGMRIAPKAHPSDGRFDVLIQMGTKRDYVAGITKVFKGEHLPSPVIKEYLSSRVEIRTLKPLQVEADGEVLGFTPATFEIVEGALSIKI